MWDWSNFSRDLYCSKIQTLWQVWWGVKVSNINRKYSVLIIMPTFSFWYVLHKNLLCTCIFKENNYIYFYGKDVSSFLTFSFYFFTQKISMYLKILSFDKYSISGQFKLSYN